MDILNNIISNRRRFFTIFAFVFVGIVLFAVMREPSAVKPKPTEEDLASTRALLYNAESFYEFVEDNEVIINAVRGDLGLFARTTSKNFENNEPVGFTFTGGPRKKDGNYTFDGLFYNLSGKIQLDITKFERGIIRLSITNKETGANIDEYLELNGPKNRLLVTLPVDKPFYSIRLLYNTSELVVTFYDGFSAADVDETVAYLKSFYGDSFNPEDIIFNINSLGNYSLDGVYEFLKNPDQQFEYRTND